MGRRDGGGRRRIVAVGHKSYLGYAQTLTWLSAAAEVVSQRGAGLDVDGLDVDEDGVDVVVFPVAPALPAAVELAGARFAVGAQHVSARAAGAYTGELPAALLAEIGVRYAEIGHAERRALFGETDEAITGQLAAAVKHGLLPLLCVGEGRLGDQTPVSAERARLEVTAQLGRALAGLPTELAADLAFVVAYEPVWAIGADAPAPVDHVRAVAAAVREELSPFAAARLIYGGTAGPGLFPELQDVVDGLFLGRRAHDPAAFAAVLAEVGRS